MNVCVAGCPRSGTTALSALLSHDKDTFITNEVSNYVCGWKEFPTKMRSLEKEGVLLDLLRRKNLTFGEFEEAGLVNQHKLQEILANRHDFKVYGDKLPSYCRPFYIDRIFDRHPHMKMIICIRDGRDVMASMYRASKLDREPPWAQADLRKSSLVWANHQEWMCRALYKYPKRIFVVRYEWACNNVGTLIMQLSEFLRHKLEIPNPNGGYYLTNYCSWKKDIPDVDEHICKDARMYLQLLGYKT